MVRSDHFLLGTRKSFDTKTDRHFQ